MRELVYTGGVEGIELLTVTEAARKTGYSAGHIRKALERGDLKGRKLPPATWVMTATALTEWESRERDGRGWPKGQRRPPRPAAEPARDEG